MVLPITSHNLYKTSQNKIVVKTFLLIKVHCNHAMSDDM